jgi:hypothetical protein
MTPSREQSCRTWEIYHGSPASLTRISTCWGRTTYDTDLYLIRNGITLRRRRGDRDPGWHLKLALGADSRRKVPLPLGRPTGQMPLELAALVRAVTGGEAPWPVAQITTMRVRRVLLDAAGEPLAEVVADDVRARPMGETVGFFQCHEVEVQLTGGGPPLLEAADEQLRRSGLRSAGQAGAGPGRPVASNRCSARAKTRLARRRGSARVRRSTDRSAEVTRSRGPP